MAIQRITRFLTAFSFFTFSFLFSHAQIGFGTTTPDASAVVHIQDTAKGLLIPRMTIAQKNAIPNPAEGLMIYQTDSSKGFWYFTGMQWVGFANNYKQTLILTGDVTDSEAAAKIAAEVGPATQEIRIYDCSNLTTVDLSMLTGITEIRINNNPVLQNVNLNKLKTVDGTFDVAICPLLSTISTPLLENVGNSIRFVSTGVSQIAFPSLKKAVWGVYATSNPNLLSASFPLLVNSSLHLMDYFHFINNSNLTSISAPLLNKVDYVFISNNKNCNSLNLASLNSVNKIEIIDDSLLTALSLSSLATVSSYIIIHRDTALSSLSLPMLATAKSIDIGDLQNLTTLSVPQLANVTSMLAIQSCKNLTTINLPALAAVTNLLASNNSRLSSLSLPSLATAGTISFFANPACTALNFPALTALTSSSQLYISTSPNLASISLPVLASAQNGQFYFNYNKLPSSQVNILLNKFATISPALTNKVFYFDQQTPSAPPTGQGIADKVTLSAMNNSVITD